MKTLQSSFVILLLFGIGCSPDRVTVTNGKLNEDSASGVIDLSLPVLAPKPVVWRENWQDIAPPSKAREDARRAMDAADIMKSSEEFQQAEQYYKTAMELDPTWSYPVYQLACNYELWDKPNQAVEMFQKAVELGFSDFPTALTDDELGRIRDRQDFDVALQSIQTRYVENASENVGQPFAMRPQGDPPADGWPMLLLLHGYGDTNASYGDIAEQWTDLGFVTVAVPGSVPARRGRFQWSADSSETTHTQLQEIVNAELFDGIVDREQVYLLGFSQGALHSMLVTMEHPEMYAGVVALSPGGSMFERIITPKLSANSSASLVFIHGTEEPHAVYAKRWAEACEVAGWPFMGDTHPGGHHFPADWNERVPVIADFLVGQ